MTEPASGPILEISDLKTCFRTRDGLVSAVDGVSLEVARGECLGVVGESGSGKSVTFASVLGLIKPPGFIAGGSIRFEGRELVGLDPEAYRSLRGGEIAITMQDSLSALNPAYTVADQIVETLVANDGSLPRGRSARRREARARALELMRLVGIPSAAERLDDYPHQFSGGMRQRIMIAISLAGRPRLLIADEPTTALDVTIQAQILELIADLRSSLGMSVVLVTHDLGVVAEYCDRIEVMYAGQVVESGPTRSVIGNPRHPYTAGLLESIPRLSDLERRIRPIPGRIPELIDLPLQCRFLDRCPMAEERCRAPVAMREIGGRRRVRCVRAEGSDP